MKVLYFDCINGIAGDLIVGSLLDLGIDWEIFRIEMNKLHLDGSFSIKRENTKDKFGCRFDVLVTNTGLSCNIDDIFKLIMNSGLSTQVKENSTKVISEIVESQSKLQHKLTKDIYFENYNFYDLILEVVGAMVCIEILDIDRVYSSILHNGRGVVCIRDNLCTLPFPVVDEMLKDGEVPVLNTDSDDAIITPIGLASIKKLTRNYGNMPAILIDRVGYGLSEKYGGKFRTLRTVMGDLYDADDLVMEETAVLDISLQYSEFCTA